MKIPQRLRYFSPLAGTFAGFILGWYLYFKLPAYHGPGNLDWANVASRWFSLSFAVFGWAIGLVIGQQKKIYGGGLYNLDGSDKLKYFVYSVVALLLMIVAVVELSTTDYRSSTFLSFLFITLSVGEIGWENPCQPIVGFLGRSAK